MLATMGNINFIYINIDRRSISRVAVAGGY